MMMHMTLYWGCDATILFDSWTTNSVPSYLLSLLAIFVVSVFYQYLEDLRLRFKLKTISNITNRSDSGSNNATPLLYSKLTGGGGGGGSRWSTAKLVGAALFVINSAIGYLLMLAIMSYNAGVLIAAVVGLGVGYLLFRSGDENFVMVDDPCACS